MPNAAPAVAPAPVSLAPCWLHVEPDRVNTHAAPAPVAPSKSPPMRAVLPSADRATLDPNAAPAVAPPPVSFGPCWLQLPPDRVNTHAAPLARLSLSPPTSAVLPSDDSATLIPTDPGAALVARA